MIYLDWGSLLKKRSKVMLHFHDFYKYIKILMGDDKSVFSSSNVNMYC